MSYAMKRWQMDNHIAYVKQKKSVSRQDVEKALGIVTGSRTTQASDEAELVGKFIYTADIINPIATEQHVNHFYQKMAANDATQLKKCLDRARRGERSRLTYCRSLRNPRAQALCWAAAYASAAVWKGFCYARYYEDE